MDAREDDYPWYFDGAATVLSDLVPHLSDADAWSIVSGLVARVRRRPERSPTAIASDLDRLCLWRCASVDDRRQGLERHLAAQESWVAVPRKASFRRPLLPRRPSAMHWHTYAVGRILSTLSNDSATLNYAALRGLAALSRLAPDSIGEVALGAMNLSRVDKEAIGAFAEYLSAEEEGLFQSMMPFLAHCRDSKELDLELQAWAAESAVGRGRGDVELVAPLTITTKKVTGEKGRKIVVEADAGHAASRSVSGLQAAMSVLKQLRATTGVNTERLERMLWESLDQDPLPEVARPKASRGSDFVFSPAGEISRLCDLVRHTLPPSLKREFWTRLAQAMLHVDEPQVLFRKLDVLEARWPDDGEIEALLASGRHSLRGRLDEILGHGVGETDMVFAGVVFVGTRRADFFFQRLPLMRRVVGLIGARPNSTTIGGRMCFSYEPTRFEPNDGSPDAAWLAFQGRGLARMPMQNLAVVLGARLQTEGGWQPSKTTPSMWTARDGSAVRYERYMGPRRSGHRERPFRDPFVERWICTRSAFADLEAALEASVSILAELEDSPEEGYNSAD